MSDATTTIHAYFRQQQQLDMPDYILSPEAKTLLRSLRDTAPDPRPVVQAATAASPVPEKSAPAAKNSPAAGPSSSTAMPLSREQLHGTAEETAAYDTARAGSRREQLVALYKRVKDCGGCALSESRTNFIFGAGSAQAPLMIVGEAPGRDEDLQGRPFVGAAGKLLTKMLAAIDLDREKQVFITNILKCRPPRNRNPESTEILACLPLCKEQIAIIQPRALLLLGRIAAHSLLETTESIGRMRRETYMVMGIPAFVTYHPAALLRTESYKRPAWEDLQRLRDYLNEQGVYESP